MKVAKYIVAMVAAVMATAYAGQSVIATPAPQSTSGTWGVEVAAVYNWGLNQYMKSDVICKKNHINTVGGDITGVYNIDDNQAVTLRVGYGYGQDKFALVDDSYSNTLRDPNWHAKEVLHQFTIMPGYRYTWDINQSWSVYAGANVGLAANVAKLDVTEELDRRSSYTESAHKSAWGFAWSVEVGGKYQIDEHWNAFAAVSYSGNTARPNIKYDGYSVGKVRTQQYIGVRLGVGYEF